MYRNGRPSMEDGLIWRSDPWLVLFSPIDFGAPLIGFDIESVQSVSTQKEKERRSIAFLYRFLHAGARTCSPLQEKLAIYLFLGASGGFCPFCRSAWIYFSKVLSSILPFLCFAESNSRIFTQRIINFSEIITPITREYPSFIHVALIQRLQGPA